MARKFSRFIKKQKICPSHPFVFRPRTVQVISILIMSKLMFIGQLFLELSCWSDCWAKTTKTPLQAKKIWKLQSEFYDNFELNFEFQTIWTSNPLSLNLEISEIQKQNSLQFTKISPILQCVPIAKIRPEHFQSSSIQNDSLQDRLPANV